MNKISTSRSCSFGTDGIRAHADGFPFTPKALNALGVAIARWALDKYNKKTPGVLIGHDTRLSCPRIKNDLIAGLAQFPLDIVDGQVLPTPAVYQLIRDNSRFDFGIVISASHNPYYDNGIKLFDAKMTKISKEDEGVIEAYFEKMHNQELLLGSSPRGNALDVMWREAPKIYQDKVASYFPPNFLAGIKIVLDCANGATAKIAPALFKQLGAEVIAIANNPTGTNINEKCGSTHPEVLQARVVQEHAHIGFAFDGDGDRLMVVSKSGILKNGDDVLFLLLSLAEYAATKTIVGTVMSNQGLEQTLVQVNKKLLRTQVGDKYVAQALVANNLPLGGEVSGHTIIQNYMPTSDGIFVALKVLQAVIATNNWQLKTFDAYPQVLLNIPIAQKKDLSLPPLSIIITTYEKKIPAGRILVRYSGTEKILRVMTEAQSYELAHSVAQELAQELQQALVVNND